MDLRSSRDKENLTEANLTSIYLCSELAAFNNITVIHEVSEGLRVKDSHESSSKFDGRDLAGD